VRYKLAFERYLKENNYTDVRPLVAFSGTVTDPDTNLNYTEPSMNVDVVTGRTISEGQLPERFASPDYQVLLVANKNQTGFEQPLLCAMYVDKRLDGVQAVQTLSRLNRKIQGKEDPFVLDFVNERENIYKAFKPYFETTSLQEASDPSQLEMLKHELDQAQVYHWSEVEAFARIFYKPLDKQVVADHAHMQKHLQPAVDRFNAIEEDEIRDRFRTRLLGFVNVYGFLSQIIPFADRELEMLASFGKFFLPHLPIDRGDPVTLGSDVALHYYRLQHAVTGAINIREGDPEGVKSPTDVGTGKAPEKKAPLSEIIEVLNDRFGTNFTEEDRLFFEQIKEKAVKNQQVIDTALSNPLDKFQLGVKRLVEDLMVQRLADNDEIVTRYMDDEGFQSAAFPILTREIFAAVNAAAGRKSTDEIVSRGEGDTTEFKSTLRVNLHTNEPDPQIEYAAMKTIAAFLNSREGGILVIGVKDDGEALGVEADGFPNEDKMNLHLVNLIKARLGAASMLNIKPHFEDYKGKRILIVDCLSSSSPVYLKNGNIEEFYIRAGASSAALPASEMTNYIQQRYN
jgi:type I restriction enzyme R subunit